ncbi:uncharacterized protein LOC128556548 [Mercenaria mercenaria]|uniref:uncharacterized protein LOC128556548 n=1 Tax=Mercenaria mercenaria TaxID=6596 RepID=UPI00234F6BEE|nr:uncharacterized protein LOC128556548 [Mercenaria mercenaria]
MDEIDLELGVAADEATQKESPKKEIQDPKPNLQTLLQRQAKFLENCREVKTVQYLGALSQLCHSSADLSHVSSQCNTHIYGESSLLCSTSTYQTKCTQVFGSNT